ncbi:hypothetical protein CMUS01_03096 [Colletotrichum musicola]|uniref:DRBM domain-containing protein n=1 Tax=Colletotrichum musicola TaxID=2175873 RepID=A0A8H6NTU9_9PEZI|nr:hypothetical protein CMUS01_03096 [Colletotrichum musicola]
MVMSSPTISGSPARERVDWVALKSYIAAKEAYETQSGQPAPLTDDEYAAIAVLLRPAPRPDPDLGTKNWISYINHFLQVRRQTITFRDEARQEPRLGKAPELRWACFLTFDATQDTFPRPGYGMDDSSTKSPDFTRKQDAKQYAAKSACQWLIANGHMLPSGELPKQPKPFASSAPGPASAPAPAASKAPSVPISVPAKRSPSRSPPTEPSGVTAAQMQPALPTRTSPSAEPVPTQSPRQKPAKAPRTTSPPKPSGSSPPATASPSRTSSSSPSSASTPVAGAALSGVDASELPATRRVVELAGRLNLPTPRYILTENAEVPGGDFWNGRADFDYHPLVPDGLGTVTKAFTKKGAKEKMAEGVLDWMLAELERRETKRRAALRS